ncbi:hypothetical protein FOQG_18831 [Fusarium oxysporum f. sp. raphani 54005]|uniref:Uncharacterized protein n=1 Tax=Fusarium oxysporum f. sp. raphani 54005 TaxID=1089458 RepID=X0BD51_FUSOX|nr:hypothetical protein FOQG_18831 [Fusarium oxysporum f. sp. raphani 54005]
MRRRQVLALCPALPHTPHRRLPGRADLPRAPLLDDSLTTCVSTSI